MKKITKGNKISKSGRMTTLKQPKGGRMPGMKAGKSTLDGIGKDVSSKHEVK